MINLAFPAIRRNVWPKTLDEAFACIASISPGTRFSRRNRALPCTYSLEFSRWESSILIHGYLHHEKLRPCIISENIGLSNGAVRKTKEEIMRCYLAYISCITLIKKNTHMISVTSILSNMPSSRPALIFKIVLSKVWKCHVAISWAERNLKTIILETNVRGRTMNTPA